MLGVVAGRRRSLSSSSCSPSSISFEDRVVLTVDATGIAHVVLSRPRKMNALDLPMFRGLQQALAHLQEQQRSVRVVIVRGEGRAFCTGLDVPSIVKNRPLKSGAELLERRPLPTATSTQQLATKASDDDDDDDHVESFNLSDAAHAVAETSNLAQDVGYLWRQLPVPVICSIHGPCYGGGLQIALGADLRFAAPDAQLSIMESKWGLIPDMSLTVTLRELLPADVAKELTFTGRIVGGEEAARLGLVTRCVADPRQEAERVAHELVQKSPDALRLTKQLYQQTWRTGASEEYCLQLETEFQKKLLLSWNQIAASGRNFGWKLPYFQKKQPPSSSS